MKKEELDQDANKNKMKNDKKNGSFFTTLRSLVKISWRNIWRNKTRSFVIIGAIAIGLFAGTFLTSFITGWMQNKVESEINNQVSFIQIHHKNFLINYDVANYFLRSDVEQILASNDSVSHVSYRLKIVGMLASAANAVGVNINAVNVKEEMAVSDLYKSIPDTLGNFLQDDNPLRIVISQRTAEKLKVKLRSKVVLNFQDIHGEVISLAFRIGGIFKTTNSVFDEGNVFLKRSDIEQLTGLPEGAVHEAALTLVNAASCDKVTNALKQRLPLLDVQNWKDLSPMLKLSGEWQSLTSTIVLSVFLFALAFGIINTMLMAVLERTHELGMLMAIGMSKKRVFLMIMIESLLLTIVGAIIGVLAAAIVIALTTKSGIDLSFMMGDDFEDFGFGSIVYPSISVQMFVEIALLVMLCGVLSAIYPARKALQLNPMDALKTK